MGAEKGRPSNPLADDHGAYLNRGGMTPTFN